MKKVTKIEKRNYIEFSSDIVKDIILEAETTQHPWRLVPEWLQGTSMWVCIWYRICHIPYIVSQTLTIIITWFRIADSTELVCNCGVIMLGIKTRRKSDCSVQILFSASWPDFWWSGKHPGTGYGDEERAQLELGWASRCWQGWGQHYLEFRTLAWLLGMGRRRCGPRYRVKERSHMRFSNTVYVHYVELSADSVNAEGCARVSLKHVL